MFSALTKGIRQLSDPATRQVLWLSIGAAVLAFLFVFACIEMALTQTSVFKTGWMEALSDALGRLAALVLAWLLFPATISAVVGLFLERVAGAVEARHYPHLGPAPDQPFTEALLAAAKFLVILVALNLALLTLIFTGPLYVVLFYLVNGYLISREFFELVSLRRMAPDASRALRKRHQTGLVVIGAVFAFLMTVPVVNLLIPIVATSTMVHLFEDWRGADETALVPT